MPPTFYDTSFSVLHASVSVDQALIKQIIGDPSGFCGRLISDVMDLFLVGGQKLTTASEHAGSIR